MSLCIHLVLRVVTAYFNKIESIDNIKVCCFNCKGIKSSTGEIPELCANYDIILIEETWLFDFDRSSLTKIHHELYGRGESAIKSEDGVLLGRPHGGIAILWRKHLL